MKRLVLTLAAAASVLAAAPAAALARHHHHAARTHHARIMRFGDLSGQPSTTSPTTGNAGTVTSFTGGVLTIQLTDGSTVSGTVSNDTSIECAASGQDQSGEDQGDQSTSGSDQSTTDDDQSTSTGGDDQGSGEDDQGSSGDCSSSNLTRGATISAAELRISGAGNVWEKVELGS